MTDLIPILIGTLAAGVGSVWIAAALSLGVLARHTQHMLSLAAGALLATAFMNLLPEAFDSGVESHSLSAVVLGGLLFFFLLNKAELWHHGHEHNTDWQHSLPGHGHSDHQHHGGGWAILTGDAVHCFGDGVLIASAFMANRQLGWATTLAVLVHEVPHHMGDLAVLHRSSRGNWRAALLKVSLAGAVTVIGGLLGYVLVGSLASLLPYLLMLAASSFIYVALADLIPQLQQRLSLRETLAQLLWLGIGMGLVIGVGALGPGHGH